MLKNKAGIWKSDDLWIYHRHKNTDWIYIRNVTKKKVIGVVMGAKRNNIVILEDFEYGKAQQLWKKEKTDTQGYFTLRNYEDPNVLTATSESDWEIKGNITMYEMNTTS